MRIAVITPYYKESMEILRRCHESVLAQHISCDHIMISDGAPNTEVDDWSCFHWKIPKCKDHNGNEPRALGAIEASKRGYDAVAFLDADNWFYPDHLESMVNLHRISHAPVITTMRDLYALDGSFMCHDTLDSDGIRNIDTSCFLFTKDAYGIFPGWSRMPLSLSPICDKVYLRDVVHSGLTRAHNSTFTVAFTTKYKHHYQLLEIPFPA